MAMLPVFLIELPEQSNRWDTESPVDYLFTVCLKTPLEFTMSEYYADTSLPVEAQGRTFHSDIMKPD